MGGRRGTTIATAATPLLRSSWARVRCHDFGWRSQPAVVTRLMRSSWACPCCATATAGQLMGAHLSAVTAADSHCWLSPLVCSSAYKRKRARVCHTAAAVCCCRLLKLARARLRIAVAAAGCRRRMLLPLACCSGCGRRLVMPSLWVGDVVGHRRSSAAQVGVAHALAPPQSACAVSRCTAAATG